MHLDLSDADARLLGAILRREIDRSQDELAHTESIELQRGLHRDIDAAIALLKRVDGADPGASATGHRL